ncbi:MAG TPA: glycosyl hydrolase family 8 [Candidatus Paceibacterota bacterium]
MTQRLLGYVFVVVAVVLVSAAIYWGGARRDVPIVFSPTQILGSTWTQYKKYYIEPTSGRTLDPSRQNVTTSEGQSYTMLRAVWQDDKATFDSSWKWTKDNLRRPNDRLSSWLFGPRADGTYGVLTDQGGENNASDADTDITMALIFAYARWQDKNYLGDARVIARDLWNQDVIYINGTPYMTADSVEKTSKNPNATINVSYLSPAAYRMFATIDPDHPWQQLINSSYALIDKTLTEPIDKSQSVGLPPDWVLINKTTGALSTPTASGQTTNFSYDALRLPYRLALDYEWYQDPRDKDLLSKMHYLTDAWKTNHSLASIYTHDGTVVDPTENAAMYGGSMGYFAVVDPAVGKDVYETKLQYLFNPDLDSWKQVLSYYDDNWAWFGIGVYNRVLPNLFASLPVQLYEL